MGNLRLYGSTSGYVEIAPPAVAGTTTLTLPSTSGTVQTVPGAWTSYTPVVSGTGWSLGNGTSSGRYSQIGKVVNFTATVQFGSTSTYGAGVLFISLPVNGNTQTEVMRYVSFDSSASLQYYNQARFETGSTCTAVVIGASGAVTGYFTSTSPFTWAVNDSILITGSYEAS